MERVERLDLNLTRFLRCGARREAEFVHKRIRLRTDYVAASKNFIVAFGAFRETAQ